MNIPKILHIYVHSIVRISTRSVVQGHHQQGAHDGLVSDAEPTLLLQSVDEVQYFNVITCTLAFLYQCVVPHPQWYSTYVFSLIKWEIRLGYSTEWEGEGLIAHGS